MTDLHQTFRTGLVFPNWSKWVQGVLCYDQNWWKLKYLSRISIDIHWQFFLSFSTFSNHFTLKWVKVTRNGKFCQKSGLDWLQTANFGHFSGFSIFSPKMRLRLTWNGQFHPIHNFPHLLPPKHLIFGEISKVFVLRGYISNFFEFLNFFKSFHTREAQNDPQWQILPKKWLRLAQNSQFWSFCRFFHLFPQNQAQIYLEWLITRFTTFPIFYHHSISFLEKSHRFSFLEGVHQQIFWVFQLFESFHTKLTQNDPQWQILPPKWLGWAQNGQFWLNFNKHLNISVESWPIFTESSEQALFFSASQNESKECYAMIKTDENLNISAESQLIWWILQKSGLDWLQMANFGHFAGFSIFSPKMRLKLTWNGQFHPIHNFSHLLPPKCLIFGEISKNFIPGGGVEHQQMFWVFQLFQIISHQSGSKWPTMVNFAKISGLDWFKMANFGHFAGFSIFSPKMRLRLTWNGQFHLIHNFSHLLPPKFLIFGEISKFFVSAVGWGYIGIFLQLFWIISHWSSSKWHIMANFAKKVAWLAQNGQFGHLASFSIFSPQMRLRLTWNGQFHNFFHLLPPKHLIFGEISKIFILWGGGYISNSFEFFNFCESFHKVAQNDPQWQFLPPKWLGWAQNGQFWLNFNKNLNISVESWPIFRTGLVFLSWSKWVQGVLCYDQNWWKLKYLSRISTDLHQTFRTRLIFLNQSKWVQGVLYYNQKWWKL